MYGTKLLNILKVYFKYKKIYITILNLKLVREKLFKFKLKKVENKKT